MLNLGPLDDVPRYSFPRYSESSRFMLKEVACPANSFRMEDGINGFVVEAICV